MEIGKLGMLSPVICGVSSDYILRRRQGFGRDAAIAAMQAEHAAEFQSEQERPFALLGLAITLSNRRELTSELSTQGLHSLELLRNRLGTEHLFTRTLLKEAEQALRDESRIGAEAKYSRLRKAYDPGWAAGDTFAHQITDPNAEQLGLSGWYFVFQSIGNFRLDTQENRQFVFVYLAEPDGLPRSAEELHKLRRVTLTNQFDYIAAFSFTSKRNESSHELQKLGSFPKLDLPERMTQFSAYTVYPLFGKLKRNSTTPDYERALLMLMKNRINQ